MQKCLVHKYSKKIQKDLVINAITQFPIKNHVELFYDNKDYIYCKLHFEYLQPMKMNMCSTFINDKSATYITKHRIESFMQYLNSTI